MLTSMSHAANPSRAPYTNAQDFILSHGIECTVTLEGLLATQHNGCCLPNTMIPEGCDGGDRFVDECMVFPISDDNTVDRKAIRNWLGY